MIKARVISVNVGRPQQVTWRGRMFSTAIVKLPVDGAAYVAPMNFAGDGQADLTVHGGADAAVYAYALEDIEWWRPQVGVALQSGSFGENLTTAGIDLARCVVGEIWQVKDVLLQVTGPRIPCYKLAWRMNDDRFVASFARAERPGAYLRVLQEGFISAGDPIQRLPAPATTMTVIDLARILTVEQDRASELVPIRRYLSERTKSWLDKKLRQEVSMSE